MYIKINVKNKIAALQDDTLIINGNSDYVIQFNFDAEWAPYETKTARFVTDTGYTDVVFSGDEVAVPVITDAISVRVGVYAGNLHTTTPAVIFCRRSITDGSGSPVEPTPDVYAQLMEMLNKGSGISTTAKNLLITILRSGVYTADQSANITALDTALGGGEVPDAPDIPDVPVEPDEPIVVRYAITNNLTECVNSNAATSLIEGASYTATLTASDGFVLDAVTVTMGGEDVTGAVYADGAITIDAVTGDIVITAAATATSVTTYTITNTLTNATNSNSAASVEEGASYSATITANDGYELGEVTVTMGGMDISASAVSGGTITIASVTGNIVITATATKSDSGEPVLVHSYIGTSVPESGVLEDQTGSFDLTIKSGSDNPFFSNYAAENGSAFALSTGDSASFKFVNAHRNSVYFSHGCRMDTSGYTNWVITEGVNPDTTGRIAVYPYHTPEGVTSAYGDAVPQVWYRQDDDADGTAAETKLYSNVTVPKGETHTVTVTVNATDKSIKMYVDGTLAIDKVMTTEPQFDGLSVYMYADCPFDRLEVYRGIITDVT